MSDPLVTFIFPGGRQRTGTCHMPWMKGWSVKLYLHTQPLRSSGLLGAWDRCKVVNRDKRRVRLNYVPVPNDVIVMARTRR